MNQQGPRPVMANNMNQTFVRPGIRPNMPRMPNQNNSNGPVYPNQLGNLEPVVSSSANSNQMLRSHLEQSNNLGGPKLAQHLSVPNMQQPGSNGPVTTSGGSSLLLSQLAKTPSNDPNPSVINEVAGGLAGKVPNETLTGILSNRNMPPSSSGMSMTGDVKQEIKQEPDVKPEIKQEAMDTHEDIKPTGLIKQEDIKQEIKKEDDGASSSKQVVAKPIEKGKNKVQFSAEELKRTLEPVLMKMYSQEPEATPFRIPVDPQALGIPDYFDIIKTPMDMSTIKRKLDTGAYSDPWKFVDDVCIMFENAWIYNRKTSRVYKYCTKV